MVKLSNIHVAYSERVIFNNGDFLLRPGDKVGLVGPNGAGKTTLFKVICGIEKPDEGTVSMDPGTVIGYFSQEVGEMNGKVGEDEGDEDGGEGPPKQSREPPASRAQRNGRAERPSNGDGRGEAREERMVGRFMRCGRRTRLSQPGLGRERRPF